MRCQMTQCMTRRQSYTPLLVVLIAATVSSIGEFAHADLLVASSNSDSILRYDEKTGAFLGTFVPRGSGGLAGPVGMSIGPDGNLYVASGTYYVVPDRPNPAPDRILRFNGATGAFLDIFVNSRIVD